MAFVLVDAVTHEILDVVETRQLQALMHYFFKFPRQIRLKVKFITIDSYTPYMSLIKKLFPWAVLILDRFHLVQNLSRAFNKTRIQIMKGVKSDSKEYRHMKYFWKLLQLDAGKLSYKPKYSRSFKQMLSTYEIVERVLDDSPELERYYLLYQNCLSDLKRKNITSLYQNILRHKHQANAYFTPVLNTMLKYRSYVENALI